jgi:hypothetical protein
MLGNEVTAMGCRTLVLEDGRAVLHCSTTETVFGPIWKDEDEADAFVLWLRDAHNSDPRRETATNLEHMRHQFRLHGERRCPG